MSNRCVIDVQNLLPVRRKCVCVVGASDSVQRYLRELMAIATMMVQG